MNQKVFDLMLSGWSLKNPGSMKNKPMESCTPSNGSGVK
jgi:hypothetical protein